MLPEDLVSVLLSPGKNGKFFPLDGENLGFRGGRMIPRSLLAVRAWNRWKFRGGKGCGGRLGPGPWVGEGGGGDGGGLGFWKWGAGEKMEC